MPGRSSRAGDPRRHQRPPAFPYLTARRITVGNVPVARPPGDLRRRARLGALSAERVRRRPVGRLWAAGAGPRPRRRRLPGDRRPAAREGLPGLVERHHAGRDALGGGPGLRGPARRPRRRAAGLHRPRGAGRGQGGRPAQAPALPGPRRSTLASAWATSRSGSTTRSSAGSRAAATALPSSARLPMPTCRPTEAAIGTRGEIEVFGQWIGFEVAAEPLYDPSGRTDPGVTEARFDPAVADAVAAGSGLERGPGAGQRRPSSRPGWPSPRRPATRRTASPWATSGATSRS